MKLKIFVLSACLFVTTISFSQVLNGYKYIELSEINYTDGTTDKWSIRSTTLNFLTEKGFKVKNENNLEDGSKCDILYIYISHTNVIPPQYGANTVYFDLFNCNGFINRISASATTLSLAGDYKSATNKVLRKLSTRYKLSSYSFDSNLTPKLKSKSIVIDSDTINVSSELSIRDYFDKNGVNLFEGIWESTSTVGSAYKLAIIKNGLKYQAYNLEHKGRFIPGDLKATFETAASENLVTINWIMSDAKTINKTIGSVENNAVIKFNLNGEVIMYKVYPKLNSKKRKNNGDWYGNGSGIVISKNGYIITNNHVVEDANEIEVELLSDGEIQKYNAEVVQVDKTNDLALLKILDINFDGLNQISYNFKSRSSDVGTKVYAFGYPMALSIMGKEIKVTDGIISSKTGFDGDITSYQITAPIQGGNSGGPLFDDKGNLIGINAAKLNTNIADNVGYSIKSSYVLNLIDILPKSIDLPSSTKLSSLSLTEQIKEITKYVVLIKVK